MKRRTFLKAASATAPVLALSRQAWSAPTPLTRDEISRRTLELVAQMTLEEKVELMGGTSRLFQKQPPPQRFRTATTPGCPRLGIPGIRFTDGSRGIMFSGATCFPSAIARGASWDPALEKRVGGVMGYEGRAGGANYFAGVVINLLRHPSWGRSQETFGEDPLHLGRMGVAVMIGVQEHMMACVKHFAGNSIEKSRHYVNVQMDQRTLREIYLPHFKACVDAGAASIMNAYNTLNGQPCSQNRTLLRTILKEEWKFPGFVLSDWGSVISTVAAARAGCDVEMKERIFFDGKLVAAVRAGLVPMAMIDEAVSRQIGQQLRFIHLEGSPGYDVNRLGCAEHAAVARECARKSMVLLKNDGAVLPLDPAGLKRLAVIGELADRENLGATGSTGFTPAYVIKPLDGIRKALPGVEVVFNDGADLAAARAAAAGADAAIVVVGLTKADENEKRDRPRLTLSDAHEELLRQVAAAQPRTVAVVQGGGAVVMESWKDRVPAILFSWYAGMEGGNALADLLFGAVSPSGKLPITFPKSADQLFRFDNRAPVVRYDRYHGYRWFDKKGLEPAFPFGFGLSYTTFKYSDLRLSDETIGPTHSVWADVLVTNTGSRAAEEIVQLYVAYKGSAVDRPVKELKGFGRIELAAGQTKSVSLPVNARDLAYYDAERKAWVVEPIEYEVMVGGSSRRQDLLSASFRVG